MSDFTSSPSSDSSSGGFISALFDYSFSKYITKRALSVIYVLATILIGLFAFGLFVASITQGGSGILFALFVIPLLAFLYLVYTRLILEFLANQFRQTELLEQIANK